jgi:hypothetical protein
MILTGSNMSGKLFLRSLGVNMVLAGAGSVVCATAATVHPLPVLVSMRLSDSLSDSENLISLPRSSLKLWTGWLRHLHLYYWTKFFRGTNSDDKRNGTMKW